MRRWAVFFCVVGVSTVAAALTIPGSTSAQAALVPCYGAPADYVAAFDAVDGTTDGAVSYPEPRVFLEEQSHLKPSGVTDRHHFEHIHLGMCFPYAETWVQPSNARTANVRYVFHNVENYNVSAASSTFVDANNSGGGYTATAAQLAEIEAAMDASAGTTTQVFQSYVFKNIGTSCRKTFRPTLNTVRANSSALVDEWFAAGQWTTYIDYAGQPVCNPEFQQDQVRARSWVLPSGGYLYNTLYNLPPASQMSAPVTGTLNVTLSGTGQPFSAFIDPDFHAHPDSLGLWNQDYGPVNGQLPISIPLDGVAAGTHRLVVIADRELHSSVMVVPFRIAGTGCQ